MTCKLMERLMDIEGVNKLSDESIEQIKRIICGTHNGVCSERFSGIKDKNKKERMNNYESK
jgi:predicted chitinase